MLCQVPSELENTIKGARSIRPDQPSSLRRAGPFLYPTKTLKNCRFRPPPSTTPNAEIDR